MTKETIINNNLTYFFLKHKSKVITSKVYVYNMELNSKKTLLFLCSINHKEKHPVDMENDLYSTMLSVLVKMTYTSIIKSGFKIKPDKDSNIKCYYNYIDDRVIELLHNGIQVYVDNVKLMYYKTYNKEDYERYGMIL